MRDVANIGEMREAIRVFGGVYCYIFCWAVAEDCGMKFSFGAGDKLIGFRQFEANMPILCAEKIQVSTRFFLFFRRG